MEGVTAFVKTQKAVINAVVLMAMLYCQMEEAAEVSDIALLTAYVLYYDAFSLNCCM